MHFYPNLFCKTSLTNKKKDQEVKISRHYKYRVGPWFCAVLALVFNILFLSKPIEFHKHLKLYTHDVLEQKNIYFSTFQGAWFILLPIQLLNNQF